jgi:hypothetical protein
MSSQRYIPHCSAVCNEAQRKLPGQRCQVALLRRAQFSKPGADYQARKSALRVWSWAGLRDVRITTAQFEDTYYGANVAFF